MAFKTRNILTEQTINVRGTDIKIRPLTTPERLDLALEFRTSADGAQHANWKAISPLVASAIVSIAGHEGERPLDVLNALEDPTILAELIARVIEVSTLSDAEGKTSSSSPDGNSATTGG